MLFNIGEKYDSVSILIKYITAWCCGEFNSLSSSYSPRNMNNISFKIKSNSSDVGKRELNFQQVDKRDVRINI